MVRIPCEAANVMTDTCSCSQCNEIKWQVDIEGRVYGPFSPTELADFYLDGTISDITPIRQETWKQWRKCWEVLLAFEARQQRRTLTPSDENQGEKNFVSIRRRFEPGAADVLINDQKDLIFALAVDISKTGMFVSTNRSDYQINSVVSVTVKAPSLVEPFGARARIVRFNGDLRYPIGYGLEFVEVPPALQFCSQLD
jgi:hypothetical protein